MEAPWVVMTLLASNVGLAVLTGLYVLLTRRIVRSQTDPNVIVFVTHEGTRPSLFQIVIRNIGYAVAKEIRFELSRPIPAKAWDPRLNPGRPVSSMEAGPLVEGIPALAPGEERRVDWGQYGGLAPYLDEVGPVYVKCTFAVSDRRRTETHNILELRSFAYTSVADTTGTEQVIRKLGSIAKFLEAIHKELRGKKSPGPSPKAIEVVPEQ